MLYSIERGSASPSSPTQRACRTAGVVHAVRRVPCADCVVDGYWTGCTPGSLHNSNSCRKPALRDVNRAVAKTDGTGCSGVAYVGARDIRST